MATYIYKGEKRRRKRYRYNPKTGYADVIGEKKKVRK